MDSNKEREQQIKSLSKEISELQEENLKIKKEKQNERFVWIVVSLILFDSIILVESNNWSAPLVIGILEIIVLLVAGRLLEVPDIKMLLDKIISSFKKREA